MPPPAASKPAAPPALDPDAIALRIGQTAVYSKVLVR